MADKEMSDGEIRYRFQTIDKQFDDIDKRLDRMDETTDARFKQSEERSAVTWGKAVGLATIVATLLAAIIGAWITTKGIK